MMKPVLQFCTKVGYCLHHLTLTALQLLTNINPAFIAHASVFGPFQVRHSHHMTITNAAAHLGHLLHTGAQDSAEERTGGRFDA